jgi:hypothetical protein
MRPVFASVQRKDTETKCPDLPSIYRQAPEISATVVPTLAATLKRSPEIRIPYFRIDGQIVLELVLAGHEIEVMCKAWRP